MGQDRKGQPGSEPELDFERADFCGTPGTEGHGPMLCSRCQIPISDSYFTVASALICIRP